MVTIEDIAERMGVSHSTVSRALSGSPLVNKQTAERIRKVASESGYQVNQVARNLKTRSTKSIGLIVPEVSNPFYPRLIQSIADQLRSEGYSLQLQLSGVDQEEEINCLDWLHSSRVDGVLLVTGDKGLVGKDRLESFHRSGIPVVLMGWVEDVADVDIVTGNDAAGGGALAEHLLSLGHKRIAMIGKQAHRGEFDRITGFVARLREGGVEVSPKMIEIAKTSEEVDRSVERLLSLPDRPTAIFAYQDSIAFLVYRSLAARGVLVPEQVSVVGFDDLELASMVAPTLTTVGGHVEPLTREFVRRVLARMRKEDDSGPQIIMISPNLIVRDSTTFVSSQSNHVEPT